MSVVEPSARAYEALLRTITERLDWRLAAAWEPATAAGTALACVACSTTGGPGDLAPFLDATRTTILRTGEGLPGRVFAAGAAEWLTDATVDDRLPRRDAAQAAGLHAAVAFPVRSERGTVGVVELFADRPRTPDPELLATLDLLGALLGQLVERRLADARHRATLQAALDAVVTMDAQGRVVEFNAAAERIFGCDSDQAVGHDMADLIVPPDLRERHRAGLRRYLQTAEPRLLDRRIEIEAQRADGARFPVELTITRIDVGGDVLFTGHVRDISDRRRAEAELRASRARIVEAADAARRRIERDLHDGAQQSLVSLAVTLRLAQRRVDAGDTAAARELLDELDEGLTEALAELRELARGIHPAILTEGGLAPALTGLVRRSPVPARVVTPPAEGRRHPAAVEAAAYFLVAEALTNAARHAADTASAVEIAVVEEDDVLVVEVRDDGAGGGRPPRRGGRGRAPTPTAAACAASPTASPSWAAP
jgi:PAS domain S-box-containing protein